MSVTVVHIPYDHGVSFCVNGMTKQCHGTLMNVSADNPNAYSLRGFKQLHSAFWKCRCCIATEDDIQTKVLNNNLCKYLLLLDSSSMKVITNYKQGEYMKTL